MTSVSYTSVTSDDMVTVIVTKSRDIWKNIEYSGRDDVIQCVIYMLTLRYIHSHLG